jgi:peptidoglycan/LPS O-acetylase OafA/YrhL
VDGQAGHGGSARLLKRSIVPEIDGLRGIAILLVFLAHFWPSRGSAGVLDSLTFKGWIGVDLFFVISGFLIIGILIDTRGAPGYYRNFYARRVLRIFPLYYAFLAAVFVIMPLMQGASYGESSFGQEAGSPWWYLLYLTNFREFVGDSGVPPMIRPLWSLAIEEQFYLVFPLIVAAVQPTWLPRLLGALVAFAIAVRIGLFVWLPENHHVQYLLTPARFDTIAMGGLGAVLVRRDDMMRWRERASWFPAAALVLLVVVGLVSGFDRRDPSLRLWGYTAIAAAFTLVLLWAVWRSGSSAVRGLRWAPLRLFGKLCYGLYVLHIGANLVADGVLERFAPQVRELSWLEFPISVTVSLAVAWLSWMCFEEPVLRLKRYFEYREGSPRSRAPDTSLAGGHPVPLQE